METGVQDSVATLNEQVDSSAPLDSVPQNDTAVVVDADFKAAQDQLPDSLMAEVTRCNFTKEDIEGLDASRVSQMVRAYDRAVANAVMNSNGQMQQQQNFQQQQNNSQQANFELPSVRPFELKHDPNTMDEGTFKQLEAMNKHYAESVNHTNGFLGNAFNEMAQRVQTMQDVAYVHEFDRFVNSLGPEWEDVYGKGSSFDLDMNSSAFKKRGEAIKTALALSGKQGVSPQIAFGRAHGAVNMDKIREKERSRVNGALADRNKQITPRPGFRTTEPPKLAPRDSAMKVAREKWAAMKEG